MTSLPHLRSQDIVIDTDHEPEDLKRELTEHPKDFYLKWTGRDSFIISLNFSFGSDLLFDTHYHHTKSDIMATGNIIRLNDHRSKIILRTKSKYQKTLLLLIPLLLLILSWAMKLTIPVIVYFIFPIAFVINLHVISREEKKLISRFRALLKK